MMDTHDTNLPEKAVELEEEKKAAEVSEPALTETPAEEATQEEKPAEETAQEAQTQTVESASVTQEQQKEEE